MKPHDKLKEILIFSGTIVSLLVLLIVVSSQKDLSTGTSYAYTTNENLSSTTEKNNTFPTPAKVNNTSASVPLVSTKTLNQTKSTIAAELKTTGIISNIKRDEMTFVWLSDAPTATLLKLGIREDTYNRSFTDDRGIKKSYLHYVTVKPLSGGSTYYILGPTSFAEAILFPPALPYSTEKIISGTIPTNSRECIIRAAIVNSNGVSSNITTIPFLNKFDINISGVRDTSLYKNFTLSEFDEIIVDALCVDKRGKAQTASYRLDYTESSLKPLSIEF